MPKFDKTHCSQCGGEFGPGDSGFSHCDQHEQLSDRTAVRNSDEFSPGVKKAMEVFWSESDRLAEERRRNSH